MCKHNSQNTIERVYLELPQAVFSDRFNVFRPMSCFLCLNWFLQFPVTFSSWLCKTASMHNIPHRIIAKCDLGFFRPIYVFFARIMGCFARFFEGIFGYLFKSWNLMCCNHSEARIAAELLFFARIGFFAREVFFCPKTPQADFSIQAEITA